MYYLVCPLSVGSCKTNQGLQQKSVVKAHASNSQWHSHTKRIGRKKMKVKSPFFETFSLVQKGLIHEILSFAKVIQEINCDNFKRLAVIRI